jgi:hypothetical protein
MSSLRSTSAFAWALLTVLVATGCGGTSPPAAPADDTIRVLFIGNSLTYTYDIPELVGELMQTGGTSEYFHEEVTFGNYSLQDHWDRGDALEAIARGGWDVVVLQQGPSSLPESRVNLMEYVSRFSERIRAVGARPAVYMSWPELSRANVWDAVTINHTDAANAVDAMLIPVGEAIRAVVQDHPNVQVLGGDGFHPSQTGSYLAALVFYGHLTGESTVGLSLQRPIVPLSTGDAAILEHTADDANAEFGVD